ncbi:MAG: hypothetical protein ABW219_11310 [Ilumatobacteraceae bacterium]
MATWDRHDWRRAAAGIAMVTALTAITAGSAGATPEDEPPTITGTSVVPAGLPPEGGLITITAEVVDDLGVAAVGATVYSPEGSAAGVPLLATGPSTFVGTFLVGPNASESYVNWNIEISATDTGGGEAMTFTGGVEVAGQPQFDEPPMVWDPTLTPTSLPAAGGTMTIGVSAWDQRGILDAGATVTGSDGSASYLELTAVSGDRFEAAFTAPPNTAVTEVRYGVSVAARDDIGQETTIDAGTLTVAGRPPAAPSNLSVSPPARVLGPVRPGGSVTGTVVVRNTGAPGGAAVRAAVSGDGAAFTVEGAGSITIEAGQRVTLRVTYSPTRPGVDVGRITIRRDDGRQPRLGVVLIGVATRRS